MMRGARRVASHLRETPPSRPSRNPFGCPHLHGRRRRYRRAPIRRLIAGRWRGVFLPVCLCMVLGGLLGPGGVIGGSHSLYGQTIIKSGPDMMGIFRRFFFPPSSVPRPPPLPSFPPFCRGLFDGRASCKKRCARVDVVKLDSQCASPRPSFPAPPAAPTVCQPLLQHSHFCIS
jgi:hypothetical protein